MRASIHFACNDPDNGQFIGKSEFIEIHFGNGLEVSLNGTPIVTKASKYHILTIGRTKMPVRAYTCWYGNWCWDAASVRFQDALRCFNGLMKLKHWHCEEGPCELYEAFNAKRPVTKEEIDAIVAQEPH